MVGANGVHLGTHDLKPAKVGRTFPHLHIGQSTHNPQQVQTAADSLSVDVIAFGPVFDTATKLKAERTTGVEEFNAVRDLTDKPLIAVGGVDQHRVPDLRWSGANIVAVAGAITAARSVAEEWVSRYAEPVNLTRPRIFLCGFMAAGKSSVGRRLAAVLGWRFLDLDTMIVDNAGKSVDRVFAEEGEPGFRRLESEALDEVTGQKMVVVACGGGVVEESLNRETLRSNRGCVVWLDVEAEELERRLEGESRVRRPLADPNWRRLLEARRRDYETTADLHIPVVRREDVRRTTRRVFDALELAA